MKRVILTLAALVAAFPLASAVAADIPVVADTNTDTAAPNNNLGSNGIVAVSNARVGLIRFDQAAVAGAAGNTAALKIKVLVTKNTSNAIAIRLVTSAWNEKTVTAKTLPFISGSTIDQKTLTSADVGKTVTFDVTSAVAGWKSNPASNFGLALVAATPAPNVSLGSREGGSPALLSISGTVVTPDNDVTVSPTGGDYPTLEAAAANLEAGDKWCPSPTNAQPCTIHMSAGIHTLAHAEFDQPVQILGEERGETLILSTVSNNTALSFGDSKARLADLTLVTPGSGLGVGNGITLERVVIRARTLMNLSGGFTIVDSDLTAIGDGDVVAFDLNTYGGLNTITRSRVTTISRTGHAQTFEGGDSSGAPRLTFTDTSFSVWGKTGAIMFRTTDEFSGPVVLLRSQVDVSSPGAAQGFDGESGLGLQVIESHINAHGGTGGGVHWDSGPVLIDNSTIDATSSAVGVDAAVFGGGSPMKVTVLRSQLHASTGPVLVLGQADADVESSVISGATSVRISENGSLTASTSQLAGAITKEPGGTASCDHVFDGNLVLRPATCVSP